MSKALLIGGVIGVAAMIGAIVMGWVTRKSVLNIAKQPEAYSKIRGSFMLALVFIETVIIYVLLCIILIIFVL